MTLNFGLECTILKLMKRLLMSKSEERRKTTSESKKWSRITQVTNMPLFMPTTVNSSLECSVRAEESNLKSMKMSSTLTQLLESTITPCLFRASLIHSQPAHSSMMTRSSFNCSITTTELIGISFMTTQRKLSLALLTLNNWIAQLRISHTRVSTTLMKT